MDDTRTTDELSDPDPFVIGLGLLQIAAAGGAFPESRRRRQAVEQAERLRFRTAWYQARRSLIYFKRTADEFETYMLEEGYGRRAFRIGAVRLTLDRRGHQAMRRMHGQTMNTAQHLADNLDELSEFLGPDDQARVDAIHGNLARIDRLPEQYRDVIALSRTAIDLYTALLDTSASNRGSTTPDGMAYHVGSELSERLRASPVSDGSMW